MAQCIRCVSGLVACLFFLSHAQSGVILSVDWNPGAAGIQSDILTSAGSNITANLVLQLTGTTTLSSYGFSLRFDTNELNFVSRAETPPPGFDEIDFSNPFTENAGTGFAPIGDYGELLRFDGGAVGPGISAPGEFVIASLVFNAVAPGGTNTDVDVLAGTFEPLFDDFFDSNGDSLLITGDVQFAGGSVSLLSGPAAVPEPGSFVLLSLGAAGAFLKWRRKRLTCEEGIDDATE
ncbi:MAG: PEP-CTERM sorting domain-containing protein [Planctomycetaceae bacterium]|nr:PEP-CTERM sorting domain-containing protein [Planctomycetaceae bacterium]